MGYYFYGLNGVYTLHFYTCITLSIAAAADYRLTENNNNDGVEGFGSLVIESVLVDLRELNTSAFLAER